MDRVLVWGYIFQLGSSLLHLFYSCSDGVILGAFILADMRRNILSVTCIAPFILFCSGND